MSKDMSLSRGHGYLVGLSLLVLFFVGEYRGVDASSFGYCGKLPLTKGLTCCGGEKADGGLSALVDTTAGEKCCQRGSKYKVYTGIAKGLPVECCGTELLVKNRGEECCNGTIYAIGGKVQCCGDYLRDTQKFLYDSSESECCDKSGVTAVLIKKDSQDQCCFGKAYSNVTHSCSEEYSEPRPLTKRCGDRTIPVIHTCCNDKILDSSRDICCNDKKYPLDKTVCCEQTAHPVKNGNLSHYVCCKSRIFLNTTGKCIRSGYSWSWIKNPYGNRGILCNDKYIHRDRQGCCNKRQPYNTTTHQCTDRKVIDKVEQLLYDHRPLEDSFTLPFAANKTKDTLPVPVLAPKKKRFCPMDLMKGTAETAFSKAHPKAEFFMGYLATKSCDDCHSSRSYDWYFFVEGLAGVCNRTGYADPTAASFRLPTRLFLRGCALPPRATKVMMIARVKGLIVRRNRLQMIRVTEQNRGEVYWLSKSHMDKTCRRKPLF